jgi:hypothetical protein
MICIKNINLLKILFFSKKMNLEKEVHIYTHTDNTEIILIPIVCLLIFFSLFIYILHTMSSTPDLKSKFKIIFYLLIKFIGMPFLIVFLTLNSIMILISILFLNKLHYLSPRMIFNFFSKFFTKLFSKCKKQTGVTIIHVIKKPSIEVNVLPDRANKYKEVENDSKQGEKININENKHNLFEVDCSKNYRPPVGNSKPMDKGRVYEFLTKTLVNEENSPSYVSIINMMKSKAKGKMKKINVTRDESNVQGNNQNI